MIQPFPRRAGPNPTQLTRKRKKSNPTQPVMEQAATGGRGLGKLSLLISDALLYDAETIAAAVLAYGY